MRTLTGPTTTRWALVILAFALGAWAQAAGLIGDILGRWEDIVYLSQQHMTLVAISGGLAILIGIPLGVLLSRPALRRFAEPVMQTLNIGTTIPTLAVLAMAIVALSLLWLIARLRTGSAAPMPRRCHARTSSRAIPMRSSRSFR